MSFQQLQLNYCLGFRRSRKLFLKCSQNCFLFSQVIIPILIFSHRKTDYSGEIFLSIPIRTQRFLMLLNGFTNNSYTPSWNSKEGKWKMGKQIEIKLLSKMYAYVFKLTITLSFLTHHFSWATSQHLGSHKNLNT